MGNDLDRMLFRGRVMIALISVALGLVVFLWSRKLFGETGGILSLVIYTFSPTMLAHAGLSQMDPPNRRRLLACSAHRHRDR
jgi:hypothetical protein